MTAKRHIPLRTCVGCGSRAEKPVLARFAQNGQSVMFDLYGNKSGRGAYVHRQTGCIENAVRRNGFSRAFRSRVDATPLLSLKDTILGGHDTEVRR